MQEENKKNLIQEAWGLLKDALKSLLTRGYNILIILIKDSKNIWDDALIPTIEKIKIFLNEKIEEIGKPREIVE